MSDAAKPQKLRLYKFATEFNLSSDSLVDFLKEKGYSVSGHMTVLTDEMISDINSRFKKDIEKAENHYRKIVEFNKMRVDKTASIEEKQSEKAEIKPVPAEEKAPEKEEDIIPEPEEQKQDEEIFEDETETDVVVESVIDEPEIQIQDEPEDVLPEANKEKPGIFRTKGEIEFERKKKGLTVIGKLNLEKEPAEAASQSEKAVQPKTVTAETDDSNKNKKKKIKIKKKKKDDEPEVFGEAAKKKKRKLKKPEVDKREVEAAVRKTLLDMEEETNLGDRAVLRKKKRKEKQEMLEQLEEMQELERQTILKVTEFVSVSELANLMKVPVIDVIQKCMGLGLMVSINQRLDKETIMLVADEFDFQVEFQEELSIDESDNEEEDADKMVFRAPVVTIMGHVDHGKTSLLDYVRKANVVAGESGGITQHIGAYQVKLENGKYIAFLDTPGHEAFTAMRARGAKVTDIVVLIVAADDAVMPQTVEAINHALAASVPIVVAINKIDKPGSNIDKIKQQLADRGILVEDWGGKYQCAEISAKAGLNIETLLEKILLEAEMLDLKANPDRFARGTVIETQLDKGRGITSTILVQKGTLKIGDPFVAGIQHGRVRAMFDERNNKVKQAGPSTPVLVLGFEGSPQAGDNFVVVEGEREAREISLKRQQLKREQDHRQIRMITLDEIASQVGTGKIKELPIIVKGDVDGSVEALSDSLMKLTNNEVKVVVIHKGVGAISEGDVLLAAASNAIIIGFHVRPHANARKLAENEKVDIRLYNIIYDAINEVKSALEGMLSPVVSEEMVAALEIRETFKVPKLGTVAGCYVQEGKINRNDKIRLFREGIVIYEGQLASLKRFKDDVRDVDSGYECGLNIANFNDIKVGDIIEAYKIVETKKKLGS
ncbi:MAG: translation initiation factor IF-2 [Ignavibacteria bacterium]|nr:translation initiation factor IF-2 [Ignavibacteria bacterium]